METFGRTFELNGPTVGAGFEREVAPAWTLRAEYRYTHFLPKDIPLASSTVETATSATATLVTIDVFNETDRIAVNTHAVRVGIAHYFGAR